MQIVIPKERAPAEKRVAATPETVKKLLGFGFAVAVESGAGIESAIPDEAFQAAGAVILPDPGTLYRQGDIVLKVQRPLTALEGADETAWIKPGAILIGMLAPHTARDLLDSYAKAGLTSLSVDFMPRITRAQTMDVLSSQSNLAGYRAVLEAATEFGHAFPMMMTAAGTIPPARVLVMGVGVAGLQAIATARRLGAIVSATDVRLAAKEQVQSLGATFVMVEDEEAKQAETSGGYAKEMSDSYKQKQAVLIAETIKKQDIVICTALIPGRAAPRLVTDAMLKTMKPGSVVVDLAVEQGGNCEGSAPGRIVVRYGVKLVGHRNMPSRIAADSSALYARNLFNFIAAQKPAGGVLTLNAEDEIVKAITLTRGGAVVHPAFTAGKAA